jgi:tetratricopeptide repeat protein
LLRNRVMARAILAASLTLACTPACGQPLAARSQDASSPLDVALDDVYDVKFDDAHRIIQAWVDGHPDDLRGLNYLANVSLDEVMLKQGLFVGEAYTNRGEVLRNAKPTLPPGFEARFLGTLQKIDKLTEARLERNPKDQEALYWAGAGHATRAEYLFILQRSYLGAIREGSEARRDHLKLYKLNPNFVDSLLVLGLADYVAGSLPWYYKVAAALVGFRGSRTRGIEELERVMREGRWTRADARIVLVALYRREKMYPQALALLEGLTRAYPRNFLGSLEMAAIHEAQNNWPAAAKVYDALVQKIIAREPGYELMPAATIFYRAGKAHQQLGDTEEALRLYNAASRHPASRDTYRADLAAAELYRQLNRQQDARLHYQRVVNAIPDTDEGRTARRALRSLP